MEREYKPSDDTFLLADCIKSRGKYALEIGTGSGYIANILSRNFEFVIATDIDIDVLSHAKCKENVALICCDSVSSIVNIKFDLIILNPPYLPSQKIEDLATDGGRDGIEVTLKMIKDAIRLMSSRSIMLLVASSLADINSLVTSMKEMGLEVRKIASKRFAFEEIMVLEAKFNRHEAQRHPDPRE